MKKATGILGGLALSTVLVLSAVGNTANNKTATPQKTKPAKTGAAPKSDSDIQSCITEKLAAAPKLKDQGLSAAVSGGVATFTGTAKNAGSKGGVANIAKACGANKVVNNITVESAPKAAAPAGGAKKPK
ncbi:MAG: BON domain-containing protein [Blastocatellia bacterium]|nr:BON domain-containing protein [Blastocatellia bacterium]